MSIAQGLAARVRAIVRRRATEQELDEEIRFHLDRETERYVRDGMSPAEARRRALVAFGGVERHKEAHRDVRGARWLEETAADARHALRVLRRSPALAVAAILTLALGIGANTAIFSAVNAVILRPLPFPDPQRLVMLWEENPEKGWHHQTAAPANMLDWRDQVAAFESVAGYTTPGRLTLDGHGAPRIVRYTNVTGDFFATLGVRPALGRGFTAAETWDTGERIVVASDRFWRDELGADPHAIGRTIVLDGRPWRLVGVMPPGFTFPAEQMDLWGPIEWDPASRDQTWFRRAHWVHAFARLRPGVPLDQANAQLQAVVRRLQQRYPETNADMGAGLTPLHEFLVGDTRTPLLVVLASVVLLLLIACANVGNLLLVHAAGRERESAMRLALGAGRGRLVRQALTESLLLSLLGGAAGLALGWWGTRALQALQPPGMLRVSTFGMDWRVLTYVVLITTVSGLLFGIAPALWSGRRAPAEALREGGRTGSEGRRISRWGESLAVAEISLALVLTVGAGLLVRSFLGLQRVDPGFDADHVLAASLELPSIRYDSASAVIGFWNELAARARALPGATGAAVGLQAPLTGSTWTSDFTIAGWPPDRFGSEVAHDAVSPDYFRVLGIPLIRGRAFTTDDRLRAPRVVIINQALARRYFGSEDPIGRRMAFDRVPDSTSRWRTIVGVVGDVHQTSLIEAPQIEVYEPLPQDWYVGMTLFVHTTGDPAGLAPALRRTLASLDPGLAFQEVTTLDALRADSLARQRFLMTLLLAFGIVGVVLAVVGVYGVLAQLARRRAREMGIRIALGARASQVQWLVVRRGMRLVAIGLVIGLGASLVATRAIVALLFGVGPADPVTFVAVPALLVLAGLASTWFPARQASRADPSVTLRAE